MSGWYSGNRMLNEWTLTLVAEVRRKRLKAAADKRNEAKKKKNTKKKDN